MDCLVLSVNFMGAIFAGGAGNLLEYGEGVVLSIAALRLSIGLRTWSTSINKTTDSSETGRKSASPDTADWYSSAYVHSER